MFGMWEGFFFVNEHTSSMPARACQRILYNKDELIAAIQMNAVLSGHCQCGCILRQMCFFPGKEGGTASVDGLTNQVVLVESSGAIMGV